MGEMDRELRNAKRPTTPLAGPYGHPLHPALVAVPIGFFDLIGIAPHTRAWRIALVHLSCTLSATTLFAIAWLLRRDQPAPAEGTSNGHLALSLAALAVLAVGGYLGGELAYRYGVRVAD